MNSDRSFGSFGTGREARSAFDEALRKSQDADIGILLVSQELEELKEAQHDAST